MREGESEGGRREGRRKEGIVTAHRQSTNVRYNELHGSKLHFWAETDAGSFVAREQIHGRFQLYPLHPPSPREWQVAAWFQGPSEPVFTSALCSWSPALGRVIFCTVRFCFGRVTQV